MSKLLLGAFSKQTAPCFAGVQKRKKEKQTSCSKCRRHFRKAFVVDVSEQTTHPAVSVRESENQIQTIFSLTSATLERDLRNRATLGGHCLKHTTPVASAMGARKSGVAKSSSPHPRVSDDDVRVSDNDEAVRRFLFGTISAGDQSRVHMLVPSLVARSLSFLQYWSLGAQRIVGFPSICTPMNKK